MATVPRVGRAALGLALLVALAACGTNVDDATLEATFGQLEADTGAAAGGALAPGSPTDAATGQPSGSVADTNGRRTGSDGLPAPPDASRQTASDPSGPVTADASAAPRSAGPTPAGTKSELVLGSFGTGTGPIGAQLADAPVAVRAWVADVNARGGLNGHRVRVVIADDGGDPARAAAIARRMVEDDKVFAFFGLFGAVTEQAVGPYLLDKGIPVIGGVPHPEADTNPMFFNAQAGTIGTYRGILTAVTTQTPLRKVALFYCREVDSCTKGAAVMRDYAPKLGIQIVYEAQITVAAPDYTAEVLAARNSGAEVLTAVIDLAGFARIVKSAHRQGWRPVFSGAPSLYNKAFVDAAGADGEGVLAVASTLPYDVSPAMKPYRDAVARHVPGGAMGDYGASIWLGGKLWERIAPAIGEPPSRQAVLGALHALRSDTLGGLTPPLTFPRGAHGSVNLCMAPIKLAAGRWVAAKGENYTCAP